MEIKITVMVGNMEPIELKVDVPVEGVSAIEIDKPIEPIRQYDVYFDERSPAWCKCAEMNKVFLIQQQEYATCKLKKAGYLFLNDVFDMLGLPRTRAGQVVGWTYDPEVDHCPGYVDFGIFGSANAECVNGKKNDWVLSFNVDGNILQYL